MRTLEVEPLRGKKLNVVIVGKEYDEPWWCIEPRLEEKRFVEKALNTPSLPFCDFLEQIIQRRIPDFVTDELGMRTNEEFQDNNLSGLLKEHHIPFFPVDIDENAKSYLSSPLEEIKARCDDVVEIIRQLPKDYENRHDREYLIAYAQYLENEFEKGCENINYPVRLNWIAMGILEHAKNIQKKRVNSIHICSPRYVQKLTAILESLEVEVIPVLIEKKIAGEVKNFKKNLDIARTIKIVPRLLKKEKNLPHILFFLNTEELASPFDISMAYDAGFDVIVPYINVTPETARDLVQDAIFSRSREGLKRTCFLIGGKDVDKAREVLKTVRKAMFKPFETSVMIDPNGAYTTASSMVAKVEECLPKIGLSGFQDRKVAVLGGSGPVGSVTAILCAKLGAETSITSRKKIRAIEIAEKLSREADKTIVGVQADLLDEKFEAIRDADIILATAGPGIQILPKEVLEKADEKLRIVADVNAVPPSGVEGLEPKDDFKKIMPNIYGIGALVIGDLKYKVEGALLEDMRKGGANIYDYEEAFKKARGLLAYKEEAITEIV